MAGRSIRSPPVCCRSRSGPPPRPCPTSWMAPSCIASTSPWRSLRHRRRRRPDRGTPSENRAHRTPDQRRTSTTCGDTGADPTDLLCGQDRRRTRLRHGPRGSPARPRASPCPGGPLRIGRPPRPGPCGVRGRLGQGGLHAQAQRDLPAPAAMPARSRGRLRREQELVPIAEQQRRVRDNEARTIPRQPPDFRELVADCWPTSQSVGLDELEPLTPAAWYFVLISACADEARCWKLVVENC